MSGSDSALERAFDLAKKAVSLGENDANCQAVFGKIQLFRHSYELAEYHCLKALELNPNSPALVAELGQIYVYLGEPSEGLDCFRQSKLLDPFFNASWYWPCVGIAYFVARRYDEAIAAISRSSTSARDHFRVVPMPIPEVISRYSGNPALRRPSTSCSLSAGFFHGSCSISMRIVKFGCI